MFITTSKRGMTLIEIMIVLLIIGILSAVAVANFVKARQSAQLNSCLTNLRKIDDAKSSYAMETRKIPGDKVAWADLLPNYLKVKPTCPTGSGYALGNIGEDPSCSVAGHKMR